MTHVTSAARGRREGDDVVIERDGATVLVDPVSLEYMGGATIDFVNDLIGQSFKIENPLATASCSRDVRP